MMASTDVQRNEFSEGGLAFTESQNVRDWKEPQKIISFPQNKV